MPIGTPSPASLARLKHGGRSERIAVCVGRRGIRDHWRLAANEARTIAEIERTGCVKDV